MNALKHTWRQLVRRRLWPVALLLVAALVAVPVVLAKPASPPAATATAAAPAAPVATPAQSYVQLASDDATTTAKPRRVLGAAKDPFEPAPLPKVKKKKKKATAAATATATPTATATEPATSTPASGGGTVTTSPVPTATAAPKPQVTPNSVDVRFGKVSGPLTRSTLTRLKTLPSASSPLVVFMGYTKGGKVAVFMLTGTVAAEGDGTCDPDPQDCQTLELRKGESEFLTFTGTAHDGQYELDLNALHASKSESNSATALAAKATPTATVTATATATASATP